MIYFLQSIRVDKVFILWFSFVRVKMKILAIGDFHGKFSKKFFSRIKKKEFDIILSTGDFAYTDKIRKLIFKYWTDRSWWKAIGLKKAKKLEKESFDKGVKILKKLNSVGKKVYIIWGNTDFYRGAETSEPKSIKPGYFDDEIKKLKNIVLVDKKKKKIKGIEIIGHGGYVDITEFVKNPIDKDKKRREKRKKRYKKDESKLKELFLEKKPRKKFIFLIHYTPYGIFDRVKLKDSPMYNKNVGWLPYNKIIKRYKPLLVICGHMHESPGKKKLWGSLIINPGAAKYDKAALIEIDDKKNKIKSVKFLK